MYDGFPLSVRILSPISPYPCKSRTIVIIVVDMADYVQTLSNQRRWYFPYVYTPNDV